MCTAIAKKRFFGRTLDVDTYYDQQLVLAPERLALHFGKKGTMKQHHAILGTACVKDGYPLFFDAMNGCGLCMAALDFPSPCRYFPAQPGKDNIASFQMIPWILGRCCSVAEAMPLLRRMSVWDAPFAPDTPPSPLHWLLSDGSRTVAVESVAEGLKIYDDEAGVLANEPSFPEQFAKEFSPKDKAAGLPGDFSSRSRFQRAAYLQNHGVCRTAADFFRLMAPVTVPEGCSTGRHTMLTTCCDRKTGQYHALSAESPFPVTMGMEGLHGGTLTRKDLKA